MESNPRYYARRAAQEEARARQALTQHAQEWHAQLARQFKARMVDQPVDA